MANAKRAKRRPTNRSRSGPTRPGRTTQPASGRYTPPTPVKIKRRRAWVPYVMFTLLGLGLILIFINYLSLLPSSPSWTYTGGGLILVFLSLLAGSQYR